MGYYEDMGYYTRVAYEDSNAEDVGLDELDGLIEISFEEAKEKKIKQSVKQSKRPPPGFEEACGKPTYEDQWLVFEMNKEDL